MTEKPTSAQKVLQLHQIFNNVVDLFGQFVQTSNEDILEPFKRGQTPLVKKRLSNFEKNLSVIKLINMLIKNTDTLVSAKINLDKHIPDTSEADAKLDKELGDIIKNEWQDLLMFKDRNELKRRHPELGIE